MTTHPARNRFVAWIAGLPAPGGFLFGFDAGPVTPRVRRRTTGALPAGPPSWSPHDGGQASLSNAGASEEGGCKIPPGDAAPEGGPLAAGAVIAVAPPVGAEVSAGDVASGAVATISSWPGSAVGAVCGPAGGTRESWTSRSGTDDLSDIAPKAANNKPGPRSAPTLLASAASDSVLGP